MRELADRPAGRGIGDIQTAARGHQYQVTAGKSRLQAGPFIRFRQRFSDEKPKAHEEPLVDDFVTPRFAAFAPLNFQPYKVRKDVPGFIPDLFTERQKPVESTAFTTKRGFGHHHDRSLAPNR